MRLEKRLVFEDSNKISKICNSVGLVGVVIGISLPERMSRSSYELIDHLKH